jgi:hypothetical protein
LQGSNPGTHYEILISEDAVIVVLAPICLLLGFFAGWLTSAIFVTAQISRSEERMQRKVRYWQGEAARARAVAQQMARRLTAGEGLPQEDQYWDPPGDGSEP